MIQSFFAGQYDVAVIGAGHAGCEAALAAARLGMRTALFTMSLDQVANMPCNPSIGGTAKGHIVCEIDALGGEMGRAADRTMLQSRMLNRGKGPAVHSLRVQSDREQYRLYMKKTVENTPGLDLIQGEVVDIGVEDGKVSSVTTAVGANYQVSAVIIASGTYLNGKIFIGEYSQESGPDNAHPARALSDCLQRLGLPLRRFKTGTPARVHADSINYSLLELQEGDEEVVPFSYDTDYPLVNKICCHIAYTNANTHQVITDNLHRSPLYSGEIQGVGARYCPSIEDKVTRFADKPRHQLFIEPMGLDTKEMYLQGVSSSLPAEVQVQIYRSIEGLEDVKIMRNAYAIEYDCIDPLYLKPSLEVKGVGGLFSAGQFNGTSGYEEAAAQGLIAGINSANYIKGTDPLIIGRNEGYIGVLIDDLVTKGTNEPYRMMTSRSEYRLLLRQDNAATRLTPIGRQAGLISDVRWECFLIEEELRATQKQRLEQTTIAPSEGLNQLLATHGTSPVTSGVKLAELMRRPQIGYRELAEFDPERPELPLRVQHQLEIEIKYEGYIKKQEAQVGAMERYQEIDISRLDYDEIKGLRIEAKEKLKKVSPVTLAQAMRISGVSPADIAVILIYLKRK